MKNLVKNIFVVLFLLLGLAILPAQTAFTSLYVFGDALSSTADGTTGSLYYPGRDSNGRVWIEVLAQRQGLTYDASKNISYYDHNSGEVLTDVANFKAPADVSTALFVVWVCNADTFDAAQNHDNSAQWTLANTVSQSNHLLIITSLYAKGVRTLIMPNAVDISEIPAYNRATSANTMHNGCIAYNAAFLNTINQARLLCPGLTIYTPDYYTLLNNVLTNAANYGLTNMTSAGFSIDAVDANNFYNNLPSAALNGFGDNFIFWDPQDPTAKLHEIMADVAQQIISPVQISRLTLLNGSTELDMANVPIGLNGFVDGSTNLALPNWTSVTNFSSTNTTQSIFVLTSGSSQTQSLLQVSPKDGINPIGGTGGTGAPPVITMQFYRLRHPYAWSWP